MLLLTVFYCQSTTCIFVEEAAAFVECKCWSKTSTNINKYIFLEKEKKENDRKNNTNNE